MTYRDGMLSVVMQMDSRRTFLKSSAAVLLGAGCLGAQQAAAPVPAPKKARITSSIMIWILSGSMEDKLRKVAETGIQSAELVSEYTAWSEADATRYLNLAKSYGFGFDTMMAQIDWPKQANSMVNPDHRERFLKELNDAIVWAKRLECPQILLMSGNEQAGMSYDAQFASIIEGGKRAADIAAKNDVTLILENLNSKVDHKGYFLTSAKEATKAVKAVDNPHFRQLFDIYHEYVQHGDPIPAILEAEPYVRVFHVADAPGRHDPGTGEMKWDDIYKAIGKTSYAGYIALEYKPAGDEVESLIKAVTQMRSDLNAVSAAPAPTA
jgi:hydroxypyruvate isomerase